MRSMLVENVAFLSYTRVHCGLFRKTERNSPFLWGLQCPRDEHWLLELLGRLTFLLSAYKGRGCRWAHGQGSLTYTHQACAPAPQDLSLQRGLACGTRPGVRHRSWCSTLKDTERTLLSRTFLSKRSTRRYRSQVTLDKSLVILTTLHPMSSLMAKMDTVFQDVWFCE